MGKELWDQMVAFSSVVFPLSSEKFHYCMLRGPSFACAFQYCTCSFWDSLRIGENVFFLFEEMSSMHISFISLDPDLGLRVCLFVLKYIGIEYI